MAIETKLPIVPVVVRNAQYRWPSKTMLLYPGDYEIEILPRIDTDTWSIDTLAEHIAYIERVYNENLPPEQQSLTYLKGEN